MSRSRGSQRFSKTSVLKEFCNIYRKTLVLKSLFNKVKCLRSVLLLEKRLQLKCFPVNIAKFLRTGVFVEHLQWLFLFVSFCYLHLEQRLAISDNLELSHSHTICHLAFTWLCRLLLEAFSPSFLSLSTLPSLLFFLHEVPVLPSYRNQSIDLIRKSIDWFLYEGNTGT